MSDGPNATGPSRSLVRREPPDAPRGVPAPPWLAARARPRQALPAPRFDQVLVGILWVNLLAVAAIAVKLLPLAQVPQVACAALAVGAGIGLGVSRARHRHWLVRFGWVVAGFALAAAAWWFVPALGGMNRWMATREADRCLTELAAMPVGDGRAYQANRAAREAVLAQFPEYEERFEDPAREWEAESLRRWEADLAGLPPGDLPGLDALRRAYDPLLNDRLEEAELGWFDQTYARSRPGDFAAARSLRTACRSGERWDRSVRSWEDAWANRTVDAALAQSERSLAAEPVRSSTRLHELAGELRSMGTFKAAQAKLTSARQRAFRAALAGGQRKARELAQQERYPPAAAAAQQLKEQLEAEARALGLERPLEQFSEGYGFLADLARQAGKGDAK
jgi:hypothetical protein